MITLIHLPSMPHEEIKQLGRVVDEHDLQVFLSKWGEEDRYDLMNQLGDSRLARLYKELWANESVNLVWVSCRIEHYYQDVSQKLKDKSNMSCLYRDTEGASIYEGLSLDSVLNPFEQDDSRESGMKIAEAMSCVLSCASTYTDEAMLLAYDELHYNNLEQEYIYEVIEHVVRSENLNVLARNYIRKHDDLLYAGLESLEYSIRTRILPQMEVKKYRIGIKIHKTCPQLKTLLCQRIFRMSQQSFNFYETTRVANHSKLRQVTK